MATPAAVGCPVCDREGGRQVRAGLFDRNFASNLLACVAPIPVFLGIVALIHGVPRRGTSSEGRALGSPTNPPHEERVHHG